MFDLNAIQTQINEVYSSNTKPAPVTAAINEDYYATSAMSHPTTPVSAYEQIISVLDELDSNSPDLDTLYAFPGFGFIRSIFDKTKANHQHRRDTLEQRLSPSDFRSAQEATLTSFYTPHCISNAIVDGLVSAGFTGGRVLDPACGANGRLIAPFSNELKHDSDITLVEYDSLSATIVEHLYPSATLINRPFQDVELPTQDVVISNPPFNSVLTADRSGLPISGFTLHDFFVMKSLHLLREGGIYVAILPTSFLDSKNADVRQQASKVAVLKGGVRIGYQLFEQNAFTKTAVDVLIFQAKENGDQDFDWINTTEETLGSTIYHRNTALGNGIKNLATPESGFIIGSPTVLWSSVHTNLEQQVSESIVECFSHITYSTYEHQDLVATSADYTLANPNCAPFSYQLTTSNELVFVTNLGIELIESNPKSKKYQRITGISDIVAVANQLISEEAKYDANEELMSSLRSDLNTTYDAFVGKHGYLSNRANSIAFKRDRDMSIALALEHFTPAEASKPETATKALIFTERAFVPYVTPNVETPHDALWVCLSQKNAVDIDAICRLCDKDKSTVLAALAGSDIFLNPESSRYDLRSQYLSGDVKTKIEIAEQAAKGNPLFNSNVRELRKVIPHDITIADISAPLFAYWIPSDVIESFLKHLGFSSNSINVSQVFNTWNVKLPHYSNTETENAFGTAEHTVSQIVKRLSVFTPLIVKLYDQDGTVIGVNKQATAELRHAAQLIKNAWTDYISSNTSIARAIEIAYNTKINRYATGAADSGSYTLPDISKEINLYEHQIAAVQRSLFQKDHGLLLNYAVGSGKTFSFCAMAHEWVRLGLKRRVCLVVPNHLVNQTLAAWVQLYPSDRHRIQVLDSQNMTPARRLESLSRLHTTNIPFVIVPLTTFGKIKAPEEHTQSTLEARLSEIENLLLDADERFTVRALETAKKQLKEQMDQILADHSDYDFASLGFDGLILDEAQTVKNAGVSTRYLAGVKGLGTSKASRQSLDMSFKVDYIHSLADDVNGVVFASGTVLNNSLVELYAYKRFLAPKLLEATGHTSLDAWATTYARIETDFEVTAQGTVKQVDRVNAFSNLPELYNSFSQFSITLTSAELNSLLPPLVNEFGQERSAIVPMTGGKPIIEVVETSKECQDYMQSLIKRAENYEESDVHNDNALLLISDAKKAAVSPKMVDVTYPIFSNKTLKMLDNIIRLYFDHPNTAQLAYIDIGTPDPKKDEAEDKVTALLERANAGDIQAQQVLEEYRGVTVNLYRHMKEYLVKYGIDPECIAFAQDYNTNPEKQSLYQSVNECKKRVVFTTCKRLSTGANVQKAIKAVHVLTPPLVPSDLEQSIGRAIRQGNERYLLDENYTVDVILYALESSADAFLYQILQSKQRMIDAFASGNTKDRELDIGSDTLTYAEIKAAVTGNQQLITLLKIDKQLQEQVLLKKAHIRKIRNAEHQLDVLKRRVQINERICDNVSKDFEAFKSRVKSRSVEFSIADQSYKGVNKQVSDRLWTEYYQLRKAHKHATVELVMGHFAGFDLVFATNKLGASVYLESKLTQQQYVVNKDFYSKAALLPGIIKKVKGLELDQRLAAERISEAKADIEVYNVVAKESFNSQLLESLQKQKFDLEAQLDEVDLAA